MICHSYSGGNGFCGFVAYLHALLMPISSEPVGCCFCWLFGNSSEKRRWIQVEAAARECSTEQRSFFIFKHARFRKNRKLWLTIIGNPLEQWQGSQFGIPSLGSDKPHAECSGGHPESMSAAGVLLRRWPWPLNFLSWWKSVERMSQWGSIKSPH